MLHARRCSALFGFRGSYSDFYSVTGTVFVMVAVVRAIGCIQESVREKNDNALLWLSLNKFRKCALLVDEGGRGATAVQLSSHQSDSAPTASLIVGFCWVFSIFLCGCLQ
ncbi:hypothetical protein TcCL_ESM06832 [Trypanosoma cruzi]|nr:hypothetical protein TcCL_ESM06832 [Trypanosoma cruzi]